MEAWIYILPILIYFFHSVEGQEIEDVEAIQGRKATITCVFSTHGNFQVTWKNPNSLVIAVGSDIRTTDRRFSVSTPYPREHHLSIRQVRSSDQGIYTCTLGSSPPMERKFKLVIKHAPQISTKPHKDITVQVRDALTLLCNATGVPTPKVTWYKKSPAGDNEKILEGNKIVLTNVSRTDSGQYECIAENGINPPARESTNVKVEFPPMVYPFYQDIVQQIGKDTLLQCRVTANPIKEYAWEKDGVKITESNKHKISLYGVGENTKMLQLSIDDLNEQDFGSYVCSASNRLGRAQDIITITKSQNADSVVTEPPADTATSVGASAQFNCSVTSLAPGDQVIWWRDLPNGSSEQIFHSKSHTHADNARKDSKYIIKGHYSLVVQNVDFSDAGSYRCEITDHANHSAELTVFGKASCSGNQTLWTGDMTHLTCSVNYEGPSVPVLVTWSHGKQKISSIDYDTPHKVKRKVSFPAFSKDAGMYHCTIYSQLFPISTSCKMKLDVKTKILVPNPSGVALCDNEKDSVSMQTLIIILAAGFGALLFIFAVILWLVVSCLRNVHRVDEKSTSVKYEASGTNGETMRLTVNNQESTTAKEEHV